MVDHSIVAERKEVQQALKNPTASSDNVLYAYKAGKNYLIVYFEDGLVTMDLVPKSMLGFYGLN